MAGMYMKKPNRRLFFLLFAGIILIICILFGPFILKNILQPLSLVFWVFLRVFVLSFDQTVIWGMMIFSILIFFILRFGRSDSPDEQNELPDPNSSMKNFDFWRLYLSARHHNRDELKGLKRKLAWMLVSIYASRKRIPANYEVFDAFKLCDIALPEKVYSFLFADEPKRPWWNYGKWTRRMSEREADEYYLDLKNYFIFLEEFMEIKNE
jgi:hypothetical protein